jgi:adenosylcobinamide kinase/adenosylcobinamide-phosphate guanylyltransferase
VLGGARSGKSSFAERLAGECGAPVLYVATAEALDEEMAERIRLHRAQRDPLWRTLEAARGVGEATRAALQNARTVLVEDLTLLLANQLDEDVTRAEVDTLLGLPTNVVLVSNEVGMGLVPEHPLGRTFRDALGRLNQHAAAEAAEVYFVIAGLPLRLKP